MTEEKTEEKEQKARPRRKKPKLELGAGSRYTSITEAEDRMRRHLPDRVLKTIEKKDELKFVRRWCAKIGVMLQDLDFYVTRWMCGGNLPIIVISEKPLKEEFKFRTLRQRTFTWQAQNVGKGTWATFTELGFLKYQVKHFEFLERINIKIRKVRIAPIVFVAFSDGQLDRLKKEGIEARGDRKYPSDRDIMLIRSAYDLTMTEKVLNMLKLAIEEIMRHEDQDKQKEQDMLDRAILYAAQLLHDGKIAGTLKQKAPNRVIQFFNKHTAAIVKTIGIVLIVWILASLIIAFVTGTPIFSYIWPAEAVPSLPPEVNVP